MSGTRRRDFVYPPIFKKNAIWFQNHASILDYFRRPIAKRNVPHMQNLPLVGCNLSTRCSYDKSHKSGKTKFMLDFVFESGQKALFISVSIKYTDAPLGMRGFPLSYWQFGYNARKFLDQVRHIYEKRDVLNFLAGTIPNNNQSAVFRFLHHTLSEVHLVSVIFGFL